MYNFLRGMTGTVFDMNTIKMVCRINLNYIIKIIIAAIVIGYFHAQEDILLIALGLTVVYKLLKEPKNSRGLFLLGMLLTGSLGVFIEYFGTKWNYWEYHDIQGQLPTYLYFVWMLAFAFLYSLERKVFTHFNQISSINRMSVCILILIVYPTLGEIITIYLGVWTYYFPYQFYGVSHHTILSIACVHILINYLLSIFYKRKNIKDVVLNP